LKRLERKELVVLEEGSIKEGFSADQEGETRRAEEGIRRARGVWGTKKEKEVYVLVETGRGGSREQIR